MVIILKFFYSEGLLIFRSFNSKSHYSEQSFFRTVLIPIGHYSEGLLFQKTIIQNLKY